MVRRLLAVGSAASLLAALGVAVTTAGATAADSSLSFTSRSATLTFTHQTHTPAGSGTAAASGATASGALNEGDLINDAGKIGLSAISPKGDRARNADHSSGGIQGSGLASTSGASSTTQFASFPGQVGSATTCSYFGTGCNPPDMALAAGPSFVLQGVNSQFALYNTAGVIQPGWPVSAQNFFGVPSSTNADGTPCDTAHGSQPFLSDPRALYDPADGGHYWAAILQVSHALGVVPDCPFKSIYWVAVSQTNDPNGAWNVYAFNTSIDGQFADDYVQMGINSQAVYLSANMFGPRSGLNGGFYAEVFEGNKADMEAGTTNFTPVAFYDMLAFGPGTRKFGAFIADTVQPALNIDSSAGAAETFVDTVDGPDLHNGHLCSGGQNQACNGLLVWKMANPIAHDTGGPAPTFTGAFAPTTPFLASPPQTQPSCSRCVDGNDLRIPGTPVIRNGVLYTAWDVAIQNTTQVVAGLEWAQVNLGNLGATTSGTYNFEGDGSASYPELMPDAAGNVTMVFDHMSSTTFPEIRYITKSGGGNFSGPGTVLKAGESSYRPELCGTATIPVCRWGDYESTSFDYAGHIWFASQYANLYGGLHNPPQFGRNWSTWIGAIDAS